MARNEGAQEADALAALRAEIDRLGGELLERFNGRARAAEAVAEVKRRLLLAGFTELETSSAWSLARGGKYFYTRGGTAIVAFAVGQHDESHAIAGPVEGLGEDTFFAPCMPPPGLTTNVDLPPPEPLR